MSTRKNPYLMLGVPYGASKDEATRGFARATRRLKSTDAAPFDLEDLNWALHQIEQRIDDPSLSVDDFRVPADPSVYVIPTGPGLLDPPLVAYPRKSPPTDAAALTKLRNAFLREVAAVVAAQVRRDGLPALHLLEPKG